MTAHSSPDVTAHEVPAPDVPAARPVSDVSPMVGVLGCVAQLEGETLFQRGGNARRELGGGGFVAVLDDLLRCTRRRQLLLAPEED